MITPAIDLSVPRTIEVSAADGEVIGLELDLAVMVPDDSIGLLIPTLALPRAGLLPALGTELVTSKAEPGPLRFHVLAPTSVVTLEPGRIYVRLVVVPFNLRALHSLHIDPSLSLAPHRLPEDLTPEFDLS